MPGHGADAALFFVCYGLFTISIGYQHPKFGYYSFDRVAQVASILVLGPIGAAWINGLASLIYPWHRAWRSVPLRNVASASLNNSGLMTLIILASGSLYTALGGEYPLMKNLSIEGAYLRVMAPGKRGRIDERTARTQTAATLNSGKYELSANVFSLSLKANY